MDRIKKYVIGIDIGGTKCAVILADGNKENFLNKTFIIERKCFKTKEEQSWRDVIVRIEKIIDKIMSGYNISKEALVGIGISCGGPLDYRRGIILSPPNLIGWKEVPIVKIISERYHVPVYLQNDANACALAEWRFGAAKGLDNVVFLTFGTGLGAGLILNGRLYHGANDMAGEIGHIRVADYGPVGYGKAGSLEGFCSGGGIAQLGRIKIMEKLQRGEKPPILEYIRDMDNPSAKEIAEAADGGDKLALEIFEISGEKLGKGIAVLVDLLNPQMIVIGSIYERCEKFLKSSLEDVLRQETLPTSMTACRIVPAKLKDQIGDYAAVSVAFGN